MRFAPPHGGIALRLDRLVTIQACERFLRDVAPSDVPDKNLRDPHIQVRGKIRA